MKNIMTLFVLLICSIIGTAQTTLVFQSLPDMPTARGAISTTTDYNSIYVSNGFSRQAKFTGLIEKYDVVTNTWSVLSNALIPKQFSSSAIIDNMLYVFNGDLSDKTLNKKVEMMNLVDGTISFSVDNPQPAHAAGISTWKGKIYSFGGKISHDEPIYTNKLYVFTPSTREWKELAPMPEKKEAKGVVVEGKLYVIGGYNGQVSDRIEVYDIESNKWKSLTKLPFGISANTVVANGNKIYTLFDFSNQTLIGCYDITLDKFIVLNQENMIGRRHAGAHIFNNKLYIVGGNTNQALNSCLSSLQVVDLK